MSKSAVCQSAVCQSRCASYCCHVCSIHGPIHLQPTTPERAPNGAISAPTRFVGSCRSLQLDIRAEMCAARALAARFPVLDPTINFLAGNEPQTQLASTRCLVRQAVASHVRYQDANDNFRGAQKLCLDLLIIGHVQASHPRILQVLFEILDGFFRIQLTRNSSFWYNGLFPVSYTHLTLPTICSV